DPLRARGPAPRFAPPPPVPGQALRLAAEEARRTFDLAHGSLSRATMLRLGADEHLLLLTMHHIISDGWSLGVLYRELGALYEAFSTARGPAPGAAGSPPPSPLPELPIQYPDFAA